MPASFASQTSNPDRLVANDGIGLLSEQITLLSGENRMRGALLGKQTNSVVPTTGTADGGNTGNGTMGTVTGGLGTIAGTYTIECVEVAANGGIFAVTDPNGDRVGSDAVVAVAYASPHLHFTIADGATDFALGDKLTVAVTGSGKHILSLAAAIDGSQHPVAILAEDTDAGADDVSTPAYVRGDFDENEITFGTGHTAASVREDLRAKGIQLVPSVTP